MSIMDMILGRDVAEISEKKHVTEKPKKMPAISLTKISGIGKKREKQLMKAGVSDIRDLAEADIGKLSNKVDCPKIWLKRWQAESRKLVK